MSNKPFAERKQAFLQFVDTARKQGIPHPEIIAAQWALESDWGEKKSSNYNYWGVKAGNGDPNNKENGTVGWTKEVINGKEIRVKQKFKDYNSLEEALADRKDFTSKKGGRYDKAGYFSAQSLAEAAMALQKGRYATDPNYATELIKVLKGVGINPYDGVSYDFSTTPLHDTTLQNIAPFGPLESMSAAPSDEGNPPSPALQANHINVNPLNLNDFTDTFTQLNGTFNAFAPQAEPTPAVIQQPETPETPDYSKQLASAFGIAPSTQGKIPDYIGEMIKSIYDQTA